MLRTTLRFLAAILLVIATLTGTGTIAQAYLTPNNPEVLAVNPNAKHMPASYVDDYSATLNPAYLIGPGSVPDYLTSPNWAYTPPLRKFIDPLPALCSPTAVSSWSNCDATVGTMNKNIPVAIPDIVTYPGSDYYELELVEFQEPMHSDLLSNPTTLRGYRQVGMATDPSGATGQATACIDPSLTPGPGERVCSAADNLAFPLTAKAHYLGPVILSQKDRPVRIKFINKLPIGTDGDLFVPVDVTIMGAGDYDVVYDPITKQPVGGSGPGTFSQNRAELHLHGGRTPWISDGTPHQWITPADETNPYKRGISVEDVPDMPATNPGEQTYYWTNQQSARFMFYHDHSWGITRVNVYVGEAAGYVIRDATEQALIDGGVIPDDEIPLVIQDKTFVDAATIKDTDPTWAWGRQPWGGAPGAQMTPVTGDLWWPHVYSPAQNPFDITGIAPMGRWAYGPYFWPATQNEFQPVPNPYYDMNCDPYYDANNDSQFTQADIDWNKANMAGYSTIPIPGAVAPNLLETPYCQPLEIVSTPNPSWGAEAFMDTPVVNGTAYPIMTVDPKPYRLRVLNAAHDRFFNLSLFVAARNTTATWAEESTAATLCNNTAADATCTEVKMLPAVTHPGFPATWPADGRPGGIPDYTTRGPDWIMIGTEGGFLPQPVVIPPQPVNWNADVTTFNAGNVNTGSLILGPAERADVIVDFSQYAGKTLILYNDAPAPWPALDPHYDYYTDPNLDNTEMGGYGPVLPGMGPNTRTIMQIRVGTSGSQPFNLTALKNAFDPAGGAPGVFRQGQDPIIVGQGNLNQVADPAKYEAFAFDDTYAAGAYQQDFSAYNKVYDPVYPNNFPTTYPNWGISRINDTQISFRTINPNGSVNPAPVTVPMQPKAIQDEQGETFDMFGRMRAGLGLQLQPKPAGAVGFVVQTYSDPSTEILEENGIQVWKITHNGVDTHPVHFHLFDVQVLNRVGWDGFIRLPDPTELGWKDTVRISPLEDTIVALKPVTPRIPFGIPESVRPLNPATTIGSFTEMTPIDPTTGEVRNPGDIGSTGNEIVNMDWEYVWHCHILSHEENDMMRPISFQFTEQKPESPTSLQVINGNFGELAMTWTDTTPVDYVDPANFVSDPQSEIGFIIERDDGGGFVAYGSARANATGFADTNVTAGANYSYRVIAYNAAGESDPSNEINVSAPTVVLTAPANGATYMEPADITISADAAASITSVSFYNGAALIGTDATAPFSINWSAVGVGNYTLTAVGSDTTTSNAVTVTVTPGVVEAPASLTVPATSTTGSYLVEWGTSPTPGAFYVLEESTTAGFNAGTTTVLVDGTTLVTSLAITGKTNGTFYYRVKAVKPPMVDSTWVLGSCTVSLPPVNVALQANGGVATASSFYSTGTPPTAVNNGDRKGLNYGTGGVWFDKTPGVYPDWVQVTFNGQKTISEVDVFTVQDNLTAPLVPTPTMIFTKYGTTALQIQYWNGAAWQTVSGGTITGNNLVWRQVTFAPVTTDRIRVQVNAALGNYSRIAEIEAWASGGSVVVPPPTPSATVVMTSPASGAVYNGVPASISLAATVTEVNGWTTDIVEFYNGATLIGSDSTAPYSFNWTGVTAGNYSITAKSIDNPSGSAATSPAVSVSVVAVGGGGTQNVALQANGGVATASSFYSTGTPPTAVNNGDRKGLNYGTGGVWFDKTPGVYPDWVDVTFNGQKIIGEIDVFTVQDNLTTPIDPTPTMIFTKYGTTALLIQYWDGAVWQTVSGGTITGNNLVWRQVTFTPVTTDRIRVQVNAALGNYSRIVEIEAWAP